MQQLQEQEQKRRESQHASAENIKNGSATSIYGGQPASAGNSLPSTPGQDQAGSSFHPIGTVLTGTEILPTAYTPQLTATPARHTPMSPANRQAALSMMMMLLMDMCNQTSAAMLYRPQHLTVFEHVGDMIPDISYLHVVVPVDLNKFENMFAKAMHLLNEDTAEAMKSRKFSGQEYYFPKTTEQSDAFINPMYSTGNGVKMNVSIRHDMQEMYLSFKNIRSSLPLSSSHAPDITKVHMLGQDGEGRLIVNFNSTGAVSR
jgi:hypothetical protein